MCEIIVINRGEKEIGTPREFKNHFGFDAEPWDNNDDVELDMCLCQVNVEKTLCDNNIPFIADTGDVYVGMLDQLK